MGSSSRRRFLQHAGALGALAIAGRSSAYTTSSLGAIPLAPRELAHDSSAGLVQGKQPQRGLILGFGLSKTDPVQPEWERWLSALDLDTNPATLHRIALPSYGHGIAVDPNHPEKLVTFEKRGRGSHEVNLHTGEVERSLALAADRQFYGHGTFSADGKLLFSTETIVQGDYEGRIAVRDSATHEILGDFPSYGSAPHDCRLVDAGRVLAITNGGGHFGSDFPANVAYVDVCSARLLEKIVLDDPRLNAGHLAISERGDLVVVSSFREGLEDTPNVTGGVSLRTAGRPLRTLHEPEEIVSRLYGETLSICIDERRSVFAATTPLGHLLTFWELGSGKLLAACDVPEPKGVTLTADGAYYVVTYTVEGRALAGLWSAETLSREAEFDLLDTYISGSHILSYSLPPALRS